MAVEFQVWNPFPGAPIVTDSIEAGLSGAGVQAQYKGWRVACSLKRPGSYRIARSECCGRS
jgi:hypothetical protein